MNDAEKIADLERRNRDLVEEARRRLRRLLDWVIEQKPKRSTALFEMFIEDERFMLLACAPKGNEVILAQTAGEKFAELTNMVFGRLQERGSVTEPERPRTGGGGQ